MPIETPDTLTRIRRVRHGISREHGNHPHRVVAHCLELQAAEGVSSATQIPRASRKQRSISKRGWACEVTIPTAAV